MWEGRGKSGSQVCGGEVSDPSEKFLLQRCKGGESEGAGQSKMISRYCRHPNVRIRFHEFSQRSKSVSLNR